MKKFIPFIILVGLCAILLKEVYFSNKEELPSALVGQPVPAFALYDVKRPGIKFTEKTLINKKSVTLLNVWATWCSACAAEHTMLLKIANEYHIPIYSIDYKDDRDAAIKWLQTAGDPFILTGNDDNGNTGIDLGVYGTPETFIISKKGNIVYRHVGMINQENWDQLLYPLIKHLNGAT